MRVKRACHADPEDTEQTTLKDPTDSCETKIVIKKRQRRSSTINCCYKDLLVSS